MLDLDYADTPSVNPAFKCVDCPREGEVRFRFVHNYGVGGDFLLEPVCLCDGCGLMRDDVL